MIASLLLASALLAPVQDTKPAPSEEAIKSTCAALEKAFAKDAKAEETGRVLIASLEVVDARVIEVIASKGLEHPDLKIRGYAVEALGRMDHPDALEALLGALKKDKKELEEAPPRYAAMLKAIARHGKESSIPTMVEDLFETPDQGVAMARILGLGHIRSPKSVEELIRLMRSTQRQRVADHMQEFRLALVVLTGVDKGTDQELWINWYGDHKSKLEIAAEMSELPRDLRLRWYTYWAEEDPAVKAEGKGRKGKEKKDKEK